MLRMPTATCRSALIAVSNALAGLAENPVAEAEMLSAFSALLAADTDRTVHRTYVLDRNGATRVRGVRTFSDQRLREMSADYAVLAQAE